jgi:PEP-CTERM motif
MRMKPAILSASIFLFLVAQRCDADLILTLNHNAPDILNIHLGDTVTFDVVLAGLGSGGNPSNLDFLAATLEHLSPHLSAPTYTPGLIVPDVTGFNRGFNADIADAFYDVLFTATPPGPPIASNGTFYSFTVTALSLGTGTISFVHSDPDAIESPSGTPLTLVFSAPLPFQINPLAASVVPEPSSLLLAGIGGVGLLLRNLQRRAKKHAAPPHRP